VEIFHTFYQKLIALPAMKKLCISVKIWQNYSENSPVHFFDTHAVELLGTAEIDGVESMFGTLRVWVSSTVL